MKILTCASYYSTGSSAVTDLICECDNVHGLGDYEFRFVQDPDGICDLEYNLVLNNHRHNSGFAIKRYEKKVKFLAGDIFAKRYSAFFGANWEKLSKEYVHNLIDVEYKGYFHEDLIAKGRLIYVLQKIANKFYNKVLKKKGDFNLCMRNFTNYAAYPGDKFYDYTREYIDKLFSLANNDNKEYIMVDQLVPASNTMHYLKFFNDIKVVCVDRDPRDLYVLQKERFHECVIPEDVQQFCLWYKATRAHKAFEHDDKTKILRINFEDLIYKYDEMSAKILEFCGISMSHHVNKRQLFNPDISKKNTRLFVDFAQKYSNEIKYIEKELGSSLYDYASINL